MHHVSQARRLGAVSACCAVLIAALGGCAATVATPSLNENATSRAIPLDATAGASSSPSLSMLPAVISTVALGDSVPAGSVCGCLAFPEQVASTLTSDLGRKTTVRNLAKGGFTTADVLAQVTTDRTAMSEVAAANVVEVEIGANDAGYNNSCGTNIACYRPAVDAVSKNLPLILQRIDQLRHGKHTLVVLIDYWNAWLGGKYAAARGRAYVNAADSITDEINTVIMTTASAHGSAYVDLQTAFKGPNHAADETPYLASDGDHPNAAGQAQIAAATVAVIKKSLGV